MQPSPGIAENLSFDVKQKSLTLSMLPLFPRISRFWSLSEDVLIFPYLITLCHTVEIFHID